MVSSWMGGADSIGVRSSALFASTGSSRRKGDVIVPVGASSSSSNVLGRLGRGGSAGGSKRGRGAAVTSGARGVVPGNVAPDRGPGGRGGDETGGRGGGPRPPGPRSGATLPGTTPRAPE